LKWGNNLAAVAERLKGLRESISISQIKLAELAGSNQSSVNRYENGQAEAPYKILLWYADYFDVSLDYIFGRTDKPQGKLYKYQPDLLKKKFSQSEDFKEFIEACFDPRSPMNAKLKEMMINLA
jgi:repressor LexA